MFTGLVECVGRVKSVSVETKDIYKIGITAPEITPNLKNGESVAVCGACLTVVGIMEDVFYAQMMKETVRSTRLGELRSGDAVNLERALALGSRLDGHIVAGHVDEVALVKRIEHDGESRKIWISASDDISWGIAPKGSIAVEGVSLTVIDSTQSEFSIGLIPTTLNETTLSSLSIGDAVNLEIDVIARYLARLAQFGNICGNTEKNPLTWDKLQEYGWI